MPLGVVDLFEIGIVCHALNTLLKRDDLVVAGHLGEFGGHIVAVRRLALAFGGFEDVDQFVVPIDGERAMRR
jgi:hypothetical protein